MAKEIILPKLGMDMTAGTIVEWFFEEGEFVNKGEPLLEILTDKVNIEVEAETSGVLLKKIGLLDEEYPVFTVIGYLGEEGEEILGENPKEVLEVEEILAPEEPLTSLEELERIDPQIELKGDGVLTEVYRTNPQETLEMIQEKREAFLGKVRATPAARRLGREHHLILENIYGTGPNQRIQKEDVLKLVSQNGGEATQSPKEKISIEAEKVEPVVIETAFEVIEGNPENRGGIGQESQKKDFVQRVPGLAKIKSMVDELDLTPRLDTRGIDGQVVPGEVGSKDRFKDKEDDFISDYGEYVKVLPKESEVVLEEIIEEMIQETPQREEEVTLTNPKESEEMETEVMEMVIVAEENPKTTPLSGKRKIIAERMVKSNLENAVITLTTEIDMTEVKDLRKKVTKKIEEQTKIRCTFTDFLLMAVSRALVKHPIINSSLIDHKIVEHSQVHLGLAVGQEDGLIVPVIRNTQEKDFVDIVKSRGETLKAVKNKYLKQEDLKGSTFTITNLGMYGILEFTAIINQPNAAILSVGEVVHRMRMHQGEAVMRSVMKVSLNLDHRIADGVAGARFLQDIKADMENPSLLLF
ncbi:MAG: dihydrolipoamide acetyltransferase family protein [Eubacteriaceae bacterium]